MCCIVVLYNIIITTDTDNVTSSPEGDAATGGDTKVDAVSPAQARGWDAAALLTTYIIDYAIIVVYPSRNGAGDPGLAHGEVNMPTKSRNAGVACLIDCRCSTRARPTTGVPGQAVRCVLPLRLAGPH